MWQISWQFFKHSRNKFVNAIFMALWRQCFLSVETAGAFESFLKIKCVTRKVCTLDSINEKGLKKIRWERNEFLYEIELKFRSCKTLFLALHKVKIFYIKPTRNSCWSMHLLKQNTWTNLFENITSLPNYQLQKL